MKMPCFLLGLQIATALLLLCGAGISCSASPNDPRLPAKDVCGSSAQMFVGPCKAVRARMQIGADTISVWIWPLGTKRYFGYPDWAKCKLPQSVESRIVPGNVLYADIVVRPLSKEEPKHMQFVCIASASNVTVRSVPE